MEIFNLCQDCSHGKFYGKCNPLRKLVINSLSEQNGTNNCKDLAQVKHISQMYKDTYTPSIRKAKNSSIVRSGYKLAESLLDYGRSLHHKYGKSHSNQNFNDHYFRSKLQKNLESDSHENFTMLPPISSDTHVGSNHDFIDNANHSRLFVGVPLVDNALDEFMDQQKGPLKIYSAIEDFELDILVNHLDFMGINAQSSFSVASQFNFESKNSYREFDLSKHQAFQTLGITKWVQISTPDRKMVPRNLLDFSVRQIVRDMKSSANIYIHCKSGKGRSATIVAGVRAAVIINQAKLNHVYLSHSDISKIVEEQIDHIRKVRPIITVHMGTEAGLVKIMKQIYQ